MEFDTNFIYAIWYIGWKRCLHKNKVCMSIYHATWCHPDNSNLRSHYSENRNSHFPVYILQLRGVSSTLIEFTKVSICDI
jgi:hypothetical protein